jgi:hypothetical protein
MNDHVEAAIAHTVASNAHASRETIQELERWASSSKGHSRPGDFWRVFSRDR